MCTSIHHLSCERTSLKTPFVACFIRNGPKEAAALDRADRASRRHESIYLEFPIQFDFERRLPLPLLLRIPMSEGHAPAADSDSKNPWRGRAAHEQAGGLLMRLRLELGSGWLVGRKAGRSSLSPSLSVVTDKNKAAASFSLSLSPHFSATPSIDNTTSSSPTN